MLVQGKRIFVLFTFFPHTALPKINTKIIKMCFPTWGLSQGPNCKSVSQEFSSVAQSCPTLCDPKDCSTPGFPVHHQLPELMLCQSHVHWVSDTIQPSHPLSSPSPPTFNLSQYQGLFQWVGSSHKIAKVLEFQLQRQSFQWIFQTDLL